MVASWVSQASFEPLGLSIAVAKDRAIESLLQVGLDSELNKVGAQVGRGEGGGGGGGGRGDGWSGVLALPSVRGATVQESSLLLDESYVLSDEGRVVFVGVWSKDRQSCSSPSSEPSAAKRQSYYLERHNWLSLIHAVGAKCSASSGILVRPFLSKVRFNQC